jgi:hypothetical protein
VLHECDSLMTINAFANINVVPWTLRNQWHNCLLLGLSVTSSHIYWEGNKCADRLANHGHTLTNSPWCTQCLGLLLLEQNWFVQLPLKNL